MTDNKTTIIKENQDSVEITIRKDKEGNMALTGYTIKAYTNLQNDDDSLEIKLTNGKIACEDFKESLK